MTESARWKATVYVGGLAPVATSTHVYDAFIPFGEIVDVQVPKNDKPDAADPHRGFAYVEFEDPDDAKEAIDNMDQAEFFGRILKVSASKPPKSAEGGLNSRKAIWEQESWLAEHAIGEDGVAAADENNGDDPMQGLEGLDVAGPKPE